MRLPIQYALSYPDRLPNPDLPQLDWDDFSTLVFQPPDMAEFPCLGIAIEVGKKGGTYPAVLCATDEVAVDLFLARRMSFTDIGKIVQETLERHQNINQPSLEEILAADNWARECVMHLCQGQNRKHEGRDNPKAKT